MLRPRNGGKSADGEGTCTLDLRWDRRELESAGRQSAQIREMFDDRDVGTQQASVQRPVGAIHRVDVERIDLDTGDVRLHKGLRGLSGEMRVVLEVGISTEVLGMVGSHKDGVATEAVEVI